MSTSKSGLFYGTLIALVSLVAALVVATKLDLTPTSLAAVAVNVPATDSAPLNGPLDAATFRNIARAQSPTVVSIIIAGHRTQSPMDQLFGPNGRRGGGRSGNRPQGGGDQENQFEG